MILCIDIGNSIIHLGVFNQDKLILQFRYNSKDGMSSDQFGIFLKSVLLENEINWKNIKHVMICSVVPELDYSARSAIIKYFRLEPFFLNMGAKTGLKIKYSNPAEIGADRIATAIGAVDSYPNQNLIVVDMGTATTICAITKDKEYLAGAILAGMKTSMKALYANSAKLSAVEIIKPQDRLGKATKENIQIGLFYGHLGAVREVINFITKQAFTSKDYLVLGTGGFSELYKNEKIFNHIMPELALKGLNLLHSMNSSNL